MRDLISLPDVGRTWRVGPLAAGWSRRHQTPVPGTIVVAAALVERSGLVLVTRRQPGVHLAGSWEFPGGKCDAGESLTQCLVRELREELAMEVIVGEEVIVTAHAYEDRRVELHFLRCEARSEPVARLGQEVRWVTRTELGALQFPPADRELILMLTGEGS